MKFNHLPKFTVTGAQSEEYGDIVKQTCVLLKREYFQMHQLFTRERWSLPEIRDAYHNAVKHHGNVTPSVAWWANRKRRNNAKQQKEGEHMGK